MLAAVAFRPPDDLFPRQMSAHSHACPKCGTLYSHPSDQCFDEDKQRIAELESQVKILTDKATAAGMSPSCARAHLLSPHRAVNLHQAELNLRRASTQGPH